MNAKLQQTVKTVVRNSFPAVIIGFWLASATMSLAALTSPEAIAVSIEKVLSTGAIEIGQSAKGLTVAMSNNRNRSGALIP